MLKSYSRIWVHAVWSTKYRIPMILPSFENKLFQYIHAELEKMECVVRIVNGMPDHVHCLFALNAKIPLTNVMKQIKGASSHFVNSNKLYHEKFKWQRGYAVFGVSDCGADVVYRYIRNQKARHRKKTFQMEYLEFLTLNGLVNDNLAINPPLGRI